ncbi:MAG: histidine triad nucleotide-binding protein [Armatimonadetes bacterium]|nr:histidine triad nucleotide-binding protein [Armatimonadota bacterium]
MDCIFCKIAAREIPASEVYRDEHVVAFNDTNPQAPVHVLVIPTRHLEHLQATSAEDAEILGRVLATIPAVAEKVGLADEGYRVVNNCRESAGQTVFHLHFHLLGGRTFSWPPG